MKKKRSLKQFSMMLLMLVMMGMSITPAMATQQTSQKVYDFAKLLTSQEVAQLEALSNTYSEKREVDIIILTTKDTEGKDVVGYMEDFYDEKGLGYDKAHGNTAILTIDLQNREVYVAGFYKGEQYLDNSRCDLIRTKITPDLSAGNYYQACENFITLAYKYMGIKPGANPESLLFKGWFQMIISLGVAAISVGVMAYRSSGQMSVGGATYLDSSQSGVTDRRDIYIRTHTTKHKKPSNNNTGGGGGMGGGRSGGGHSHSGSRGGF